jgi:multidrug efflux pump
MFGLVLAIGCWSTMRSWSSRTSSAVMSEEGLSPREATRKPWGRSPARSVGVAVVLSAVFVPDGLLGRVGRRDLPSVSR